MSLESLGICEASTLLNNGNVSALELVNDCLKRIQEHDDTIQAWAWLDPEYARKQATHLDAIRSQGKPVGRLHGIPIAIKDIIDTALIPTEHGSSIFSGRKPKNNAVLVERLLQQGAVMMGKSVTTSLATFVPGKTTNPHNAAHTPGGSSSGSAAAVASYMTPGAIGTQTNGSVIRPAAFCGTVGYKPSFGLIPRTGVLRQSPFLDQVGVFARHVEDAALMAEVMMGPDGIDTYCLPQHAPQALQQICAQEPPLPPKFAFVKTAAWDQADSDTQEGLAEVVDALGDQVTEVSLADSFSGVWSDIKAINEAEIAAWYGPLYRNAKEQLDPSNISQIESGMAISASRYIEAMGQRSHLNGILEEIFDEYDAIICPSAIGEAPKGLSVTGDPVFCSPWSLCGVPAVTLPLLQGSDGLPIGVQLVGANLDDGRLLRTARWLHQELSEQN
ncbi:MAG: amidase [Gammaproteobacteria bacterium]|nr:amidase [Gammaproteobacteria bacterium]